MQKIKILLNFFLMSMFTFGFGQDFYQKQWLEIKNIAKKGSYKSALPMVKNIHEHALRDHNTPQLVRALKVESEIVRNTQDDPQNDAATQFFVELNALDTKLSGSDRLVFHILKNEFVKQYFENNQWKIRQQTNISSQDLAKLEIWSVLDFKQWLGKNFEDLKNKESELRKIPLSKYKDIFGDIFDEKKDEKFDFQFFPTAADWNSVLYIDFLNDRQLFTPNEIAANRPKILSEYDALIAQNSGNSKLYFQDKKLGFICDKNCDNRLDQLIALYNSPAIGDYKVMIASEIIDELVTQKKSVEALSWIEKVKAAYPKSEFLNVVLNAKNNITNPSLTIYFEQETQSGKPIHIVSEAKNATNFTLKIYEATDIPGFIGYLKNPYGNRFSGVKKSLVRTENFTLPSLNDYQNHKTSLEVQPLPSGIYLVEYLVDSEKPKEFYFIVSDSRIVSENKGGNGNPGIQKLVSREDGAPLAGREITIYNLESKNLEKSTIKTDDNGNFRFPNSLKDNRYARYLVVAQGKDYQLVNFYGDRFTDDNLGKQDRSQAQIFLDRGIYRPGQTVYFKVINTTLSSDKERVAVGLKQKITLLDANGQEVSSQEFTTNDFGSYHGSFILPNGKLNGNFSLKTESAGLEDYKNFRVEEYKRPNFELSFEPVKGEYRYGQIIEIQGKASTFSGLAMANTAVQYEIKRHDVRGMFFSRLPYGSSNENSILGETKTDAKGEFKIRIDLKKDPDKKGVQIDEYQVNASVTDINGETQAAQTSVRVSSVSHYLEISETRENFFSDEDVNLKINAKNYSRQVLDKSFSLKLSKIQDDERVFRSNFESRIQDLPKLSKNEFVAEFPHDYFEEKDRSDKPEITVFDRSGEKNLAKIGKLAPGDYKIQAYNMEGSDTIRTVKTFTVFDRKKLAPEQKPFLKIVAEKDSLQRGQSSKIYVYSAIPAAKVLVFAQNGSGETRTETLTLNNGVAVFNFQVPKDQKVGELNFQFQIVAFNDVQTKTAVIKIADDKDALRIETTTFRDKIEPGSKEKWAIKVTGIGKEAVNAEVLANMYDMSLDKFAENNYTWQRLFNILNYVFSYDVPQNLGREYYSKREKYLHQLEVSVPQFSWFDDEIFRGTVQYKVGLKTAAYAPPPLRMMTMNVASDVETGKAGVSQNIAPEPIRLEKTETPPPSLDDLQYIPIRQNLNETAFFYPDLKTDKDGNVAFEFTSPEALTQWKMMFLAHTRDARAATLEKEVLTQKDFSVAPNYPRFLREGDEIVFQSKISSMAEKTLSGNAGLQILDAATNADISQKFMLNNAVQNFSVGASGSTATSWKIRVPKDISSVIFKVSARAGSFSDGEQKAVPILPNRILVTDAQPIFVKEGQTRTFTLENLKNAASKSIENYSNTLEISTNPVWEMIFALPSLKDDPGSSADVVFNKWFADVLAAEIFKANPKLKKVFEEYRAKSLLNSNLDKNRELKQLLLEETPWVLESISETEQMERISRLFDANTMQDSITSDWAELAALQNPDGGFSWYAGYPSSYGTSLYILKNLGKINIWLKDNLSNYQTPGKDEMVSRLVNFVDNELNKSQLHLQNPAVLSNYMLDYLDARHYWEAAFPLKNEGLKLKNFVISEAPKTDIRNYTFFGLHRAALLFSDYKLAAQSKKLLTYLKETSTESETQGAYWKKNLNGWGWYSSAVVNQAGAIEAFQKLSPADENFIEEMKIWLITQKETGSRGSSRATAEVIFTMLNSGKSWTAAESDKAEILWGGRPLKPQTEAMGYVKEIRKSDVLDKDLATVTVKKSGAGVAQGGIFLQYYEDADRVKSSESYISISKELYRNIKTENGGQLQKISAETPLKVGDRVTVRMILNTDRDMEFVHIKDMRAAGFEPLDVLSGYRRANGLGYYQSTRDASTNFYIQDFPKGKYVFEYGYICNAAGSFSGGITTLQNYYAPQMNAHSVGTKVFIKE